MSDTLLQVTSVIKYFTLWRTGMIITELVEDLILVSVVPVRKFALSFGIPLILFVVLVTVKVDFVLGVLVVWIFSWLCHVYKVDLW